jgi:ribose transport system permease protein
MPKPDTATAKQSGGVAGAVPGGAGGGVVVTHRFDWREYIVYFGLVLVFAFFAITVGSDGFLNGDNLLNVVRQTTVVSVMAVGLAFTLSAGEIDLSIGSIVALAALVTAVLLRDVNMPVAVLGGLAVGLVAGLVNGLATVKLKVPSFLVTLGTMSLLSGLARRITNLQAVPVQNEVYNFVFGSGSIGPVPILLVWTLVTLAVGHAVYNNTVFGRHIQATGGNRAAAGAVGIKTDRLRVASLVISAMTAALAGMLYTGRLNGARYTLGDADLLTVIAAVVIGGTSLLGGKGSVVGAVMGSLLMGIVNNGLVLMGLDVSQQMMVRGVLIVAAVALSLRERSR